MPVLFSETSFFCYLYIGSSESHLKYFSRIPIRLNIKCLTDLECLLSLMCCFFEVCLSEKSDNININEIKLFQFIVNNCKILYQEFLHRSI